MGRSLALRSMTVGETTFRWKADWVYISGRRTVRLRVWGGDKTNQALHAQLVANYRGVLEQIKRGELSPGATIVDDIYIQPREVRIVIEYGLAHGWNPHAHGKPFRLTASNTPFLDNFTLVTSDGG